MPFASVADVVEISLGVKGSDGKLVVAALGADVVASLLFRPVMSVSASAGWHFAIGKFASSASNPIAEPDN